MPTAWKLKISLLAFCVITARVPTTGAARLGDGKATAAGSPLSNGQEQQAAQAEPNPDSEEASADDESAPAALQLDVSNTSPLIRELYQATRETKEKTILEHLAQAKKLVDSGTDVKAADAQGRTALHWTIFGSSYNTKPSILVAYEEIADALIGQGVDINREDLSRHRSGLPVIFAKFRNTNATDRARRDQRVSCRVFPLFYR
jgi:hypothetical protein